MLSRIQAEFLNLCNYSVLSAEFVCKSAIFHKRSSVNLELLKHACKHMVTVVGGEIIRVMQGPWMPTQSSNLLAICWLVHHYSKCLSSWNKGLLVLSQWFHLPYNATILQNTTRAILHAGNAPHMQSYKISNRYILHIVQSQLNTIVHTKSS